MSIYKRGKTYWYQFMLDGERIQESSRQGNQQVARDMEAAHRTRLVKERDERQAKAEQFGCPLVRVVRCPECDKWFDTDLGANARDGKRVCSDICRTARDKKATPVPTLADFCEQRFKPWAKSTFEKTCRNNWHWYRAGIRALTDYKPLANLKLSEIHSEQAADFASHQQAQDFQVSTINSALRVLRRILRLAVEWGALDKAPRISLLPGERHREIVVSPEEEARYLAAAPPLLADVATVLADTGLRPDECYSLRWENITWSSARNGTLLVPHGKTPAARRLLPLTSRVRTVLESRWERAEEPQEGWVWPAPTKSGHIDHSTLKKQHDHVFSVVNAEAKKNDQKGLRRWVLYSFRHTFLTRLGESGCDAWTLARIAGHSNVSISARYVHPSDTAVQSAFVRLTSPKPLLQQ